MRNINYLLDKYKHEYIPGEMRSPEFDRKRKQLKSRQRKHELADEIGSLMFLRNEELETVHYLVDKITNFKTLHGNASTEAVIAAFCFTFVRIRNSSARMEDYKACRLYGLTPSVWGTVQSKIIHVLLSQAPLSPISTSRYDNNILVKGSLQQARSLHDH